MSLFDVQLKRAADLVIARDDLRDGMTVVAGVSGGADSVFLLYVLQFLLERYNLTVICACLDHGLRDESRKEYDFVRELSGQMGFRFHGGVTSPGKLVDSPGKSIEMAARTVRHRFLRSVAGSHDADWIALGHNGTDNLETICMNVNRGTGLRGLGGMLDSGKGMIRPLLHLDGSEIRHALTSAGVPFTEDSSNDDASIQRNRVRNILLPAWMDTFGNDAAERWLETAKRLRGSRSVMDRLLRQHLADTVSVERAAIRVERRMLVDADQAMAMEILMHLLERCTGSTWFASATILRELLRFCQKNGYGEVDPFRRGTVRIYRSGRWIYFTRNPLPVRSVCIQGPGRYPGWFGELVVVDGRLENRDTNRVSQVDFPFPWTFAPIGPGDVVRAGNRETVAGTFLKKNGFGKLEREQMPVLKCGPHVFWIPDFGPVNDPTGQDTDQPILVYMDTRAGLQSPQITGQKSPDV